MAENKSGNTDKEKILAFIGIIILLSISMYACNDNKLNCSDYQHHKHK